MYLVGQDTWEVWYDSRNKRRADAASELSLPGISPTQEKPWMGQ